MMTTPNGLTYLHLSTAGPGTVSRQVRDRSSRAAARQAETAEILADQVNWLYRLAVVGSAAWLTIGHGHDLLSLAGQIVRSFAAYQLGQVN